MSKNSTSNNSLTPLTAKVNLVVGTLIAGFLVLGAITAWGAKAPVSPEGLQQEATHIVSGTVIEVTSKTQKSKVETAWGINRDRVFKIKVKVKRVSKGNGVNAGDEIEVVAWQPASRIPFMPGLQGHGPIPNKGNTVKVYLQGKGGNAFEPIMPNGIVIEKDADPK